MEIAQRWGSILLTWENETSCAVFLKQCFGNDTPAMNKVWLKATKLIYVPNNQLVTNTKELNTKILYKLCKFIYNLISKKFLQVSQVICKSVLVVWSKILRWPRKYYKNGYFNAFREIMRVEVVREIMRVEVVRSFWNTTEICNE